MSNSKNNSTSNLNESNMPLLSGEDKPEKSGETPEKEAFVLEMELQEKEDSGNEKSSEEKPKEPKSSPPKKPSCINVLSHGLDLQNRNPKSINEEIDIGFDDVLAEPFSTHGFDCAWRLSYVIFSQVKSLAYRLLASLIVVPASIFWGVLFAVLTVVHVWVLAPSLKVFDMLVSVLRKVMMGLMMVTLEPIAYSVGSVFSRVSMHHRKNILEEP